MVQDQLSLGFQEELVEKASLVLYQAAVEVLLWLVVEMERLLISKELALLEEAQRQIETVARGLWLVWRIA